MPLEEEGILAARGQDVIEREFKEEAGTAVRNWKEFALLQVAEGTVYFFVAHGSYVLRSMTEEKIEWYNIKDLNSLPTISNLRWMIPLALDSKNSITVSTRL